MVVVVVLLWLLLLQQSTDILHLWATTLRIAALSTTAAATLMFN